MRANRVLPLVVGVAVLVVVGALVATISRGDALTPLLLALGWCVLGLVAAALARSRTTAPASTGGRSWRRVLFYAVGGPLAWAVIELTGAGLSTTPTASAQEAPPPPPPAPEAAPPPAPEPPAPEPPAPEPPAPEPPAPEPQPEPQDESTSAHQDPPDGVEASDEPMGEPQPEPQDESTSAHQDPPDGVEASDEPMGEPQPEPQDESTTAHEDPPDGVMEASDAPAGGEPEFGSEPMVEESTSAHEDPPDGVEASDEPMGEPLPEPQDESTSAHEDPPDGVEASDEPMGEPLPEPQDESTSAHEDPPDGVEASDEPMGEPLPEPQDESTSAHEDPPDGVEASDEPMGEPLAPPPAPEGEVGYADGGGAPDGAAYVPPLPAYDGPEGEEIIEGTKHLPPEQNAGLPGDTTGGVADSTAFGTEHDAAAAHRTGWVRDHYREGDYTIRLENRDGVEYVVWETSDGGYLDARTDGTGGSSGRGGDNTSHKDKGFAENTGGDHADIEGDRVTYIPGGDPQVFDTEPIAPEQYSPGTPLPGDAAAVRDEWNAGAGGPGEKALVVAETPIGDQNPELGRPYGLQVAEWQDPKITADDVAQLDADVYTRDPNDPNDVTHFDNRTLTGEKDVVLTQGKVVDPALEQQINDGQQAPTDFAESPDGKVLNYGDTGNGDGSFQVSAPNDVRAVVSDANGDFSQGPDPASPNGIQPGERFNVPAVAAGARVPDSDQVLAEVVRDDVVRGDGQGAPTGGNGYAIDERHVAGTPGGPNPDGLSVYNAETGTWSTESKPGAGGTSWYSESNSTGEREKRALHEDGKIWVTQPGATEPTLAWEPGSPEGDNQREVRLTGGGTFVGTDLRTGEVKPLLGNGPVDGPTALPSTVDGPGPEPTDVQRRNAAISYLASQGELRDKDGNLIDPAAAMAAADRADATNPAQFVVVHPDGTRHYVGADAAGSVATQNSGFETEVVNAPGVPELRVPREGLFTIQGEKGERTNVGALPQSIVPGVDAGGAEGFASTQENLDGSTAVHFDTGRGSGYTGGTNPDGTEQAREPFSYPTVINGEPVTLPDGSKLDLPLHNQGGYYGTYAPDRGVLRKGDSEVPVQVTLTPDGTGVQYVAPVDGAELPTNLAPELIHPDHRNGVQQAEVWLEDTISNGVEDLGAWADAQPNPDGVLDAFWTLDRQIAVGLAKGVRDGYHGLEALDEIDQLTHRAWFEGDEDAKRQLAEMDQRLIEGARNGVYEFGQDPLGNIGRGAEATVNWLGERAADPGETIGYAATLFGPAKGIKAPGVARHADLPTVPKQPGLPEGARPARTMDTGYGPADPPARLIGPWTRGDVGKGAYGKPPRHFGGDIHLHHADQMPGSAIHELPAEVHRQRGMHPNGNRGQGVTPAMRKADKELHWFYRSQEAGWGHYPPHLWYDNWPAGAARGSWVAPLADEARALSALGLPREQVVARLAERIAEQRAKLGDVGGLPTRMAHDPNGPGRPAPALKATGPDSRTAWSSDVAGATTKINRAKQQRYLDPASNRRLYPEFDPEVLARTAAQAAGLPRMAAAKPYGRFSTASAPGKAKVRFNHDVGLYRGRPTNTVVVRSNKAGEVYVKPVRPPKPGSDPWAAPVRKDDFSPENVLERAAQRESEPPFELGAPERARWTEMAGGTSDNWVDQVIHYERLNDELMRPTPKTPSGRAAWASATVARAIAAGLKPFKF